jgi:IPT/TIG domain-containing protein
MNPEEYLDRLIESRERGREHLSVANDEIAVCLAAAEVLTQLREIDTPPEFAGHLELYIRARARSFGQQNGRAIPGIRHRSPAGSQRFMMGRAWIAVLGIAAVLMLACIGVLTASARSLPGDTLYGLKQAENQFKLTFASDPQDRVNVQIDQLHSALVDLSTVVNGKRDDDAIRLALNIVAAKTNDSRGAVAALPAGSERETAQRGLDGILAGEEQALRHLLDHVDWPIRLAFTRQLGALGDPVPAVTRVIVRTQSNGSLLITLTGTHFAPNAELIIDGRPGGVVSQSSSEQLVAVISNSAWSAGEHALGVLNPDGTAAQIDLDGDNQVPNQQGDDHSRHGTPVPGGDSGE